MFLQKNKTPTIRSRGFIPGRLKKNYLQGKRSVKQESKQHHNSDEDSGDDDDDEERGSSL